jgi:hypothetical protein
MTCVATWRSIRSRSKLLNWWVESRASKQPAESASHLKIFSLARQRCILATAFYRCMLATFSRFPAFPSSSHKTR